MGDAFQNRERLVMRAGLVAIGSNVAITAARAVGGLLAGSTAVVADAVNSGTDVLATLVVLGGTRIASRPADADHPYGHEKAEPVAAKLVGLIVTATGAVTAAGAVRMLGRGSAEPVGIVAAWVTLATMLAKELLARHLFRVAHRTDSQALAADAANQRTDVLTSGAALAGALGGRLGTPVLDPAMGILVAGLILRVGLGLYWRAVHELMDRSPEPATMERLRAAAAGVAGVLSVDQLKARVSGAGIYADCKIGVKGQLTVEEGHAIAARVKGAVLVGVHEARDVLVHVNPWRGRA